VWLGITRSQGNMGSGSSGRFAQWSASGCEVGEVPVDPHEPGENGAPSLAERIEALWGDATYPGEWDDGEATELSLAIEVSDSVMACRGRRGDVAIPVRATYGTTDGRIESHATDAHVNSGLDVNLSLWIDDALHCASASDELPYTLLGCAELESVQIQLGINYDRGVVSVTDSGLNAYETHRGGDGPEGAADDVRRLTLSPE
jgi:hypothetical protein